MPTLFQAIPPRIIRQLIWLLTAILLTYQGGYLPEWFTFLLGLTYLAQWLALRRAPRHAPDATRLGAAGMATDVAVGLTFVPFWLGWNYVGEWMALLVLFPLMRVLYLSYHRGLVSRRLGANLGLKVVLPVFITPFFLGFIFWVQSYGFVGNRLGRLIDHREPGRLVAAHRGGAALAPENTLSAFRKALALGAPLIELDVCHTKDSVVAVLHDATIDRTSNGTGRVVDYAYRDLLQFDFGSWFGPTYRNERIPTLEDVLRLVDGRAKLLIEIKKGDDFYPRIEKHVVDLIRKYRAEKWCTIMSFYDQILANVDRAEAAGSRHLVNRYSGSRYSGSRYVVGNQRPPVIRKYKVMVGKWPPFPAYYDDRVFKLGEFDEQPGVQGITIYYQFLNRSLVRRLKRKGYDVYVWTVNEPEAMAKIRDLGVDALITDRPDKALELLRP
ncbi:MAG: hypothetical protein H7Z75_16205 [Ferruginibacter sp.]|nr:hypothetical protein [Cytophagales bacterium]